MHSSVLCKIKLFIKTKNTKHVSVGVFAKKKKKLYAKFIEVFLFRD